MGPGTSSVALLRLWPAWGGRGRCPSIQTLPSAALSTSYNHDYEEARWKRALGPLSDHREFSLDLPQHLAFSIPAPKRAPISAHLRSRSFHPLGKYLSSLCRSHLLVLTHVVPPAWTNSILHQPILCPLPSSWAVSPP